MRVFSFSSIEEPNRTIEVEISENAQRRGKLKQAMKEEQSTPQEQLRDEALKVIKGVQRLKKQLQSLSPEVAQAVRSSIEWRSAHEELITALAWVERREVEGERDEG